MSVQQKIYQLLGPKSRQQAFRILPAPVRHKLVDVYVALRSRRLIKDVDHYSDGKEAKFWEKMPLQDQYNSPLVYAKDRAYDWGIRMIVNQIKSRLKAGKVMEFGCNAGRVLNCVADAGFETLGVEINPEAVRVAKEVFPILGKTEFRIGDGVKVLPEIPNAYVDLIYTSAVLRHISPQAIEVVARELSRISRKFIITLEDEASLSSKSFPRNYSHVFSKYGWREIHREYAIDCILDYSKGEEPGSIGTILRVFSKE